jgi:hypothetical protein
MGIKFMAAQRGQRFGRFRSTQKPIGTHILDNYAAHKHPKVIAWLADYNTDPKPFRWKAGPDKIIAAASRWHQTTSCGRLSFSPAFYEETGERSCFRPRFAAAPL